MVVDPLLRFRVESLTDDPWGEKTAHFVTRNDKIVSLITRIIPTCKSLKCLDLGCGTGVLARETGKLFRKFYACDSAEQSLARAKSGGGSIINAFSPACLLLE